MSSESEQLADAIAERLYKALSMLGKGSSIQWTVHESEFLPANVTCDYAGQRNFINMMASVIREGLQDD